MLLGLFPLVREIKKITHRNSVHACMYVYISKCYQLESCSFGFVTIFSPDKPLQGTKVTVSLKPACLKNTLILSTISLNLSLDQFTVSNLLTTTASCDTPKYSTKIQNCNTKNLY